MATFTNQATLSYTGGSIHSNLVTGEIAETLTVTKTAISDGYEPGGTAVYAVSIVNAGESAMSGLTLTDDLGGYLLDEETVYPLSYESGSLLLYTDGQISAATTPDPVEPLTISGLTVPALGSLMLIYRAQITEYAPLEADAQIENTVTVTGGCIVTPKTASAVLSLSLAPRLSIAKSVSPELVSGCSELSYSFVIQNAGSEAGADAGIVVSDIFNPILHNLEVTLDGAPLPAASYSYEEASGSFATVAGAISVPAASFSQAHDGSWMTTPGITVLTVSGSLG